MTKKKPNYSAALNILIGMTILLLTAFIAKDIDIWVSVILGTSGIVLIFKNHITDTFLSSYVDDEGELMIVTSASDSETN